MFVKCGLHYLIENVIAYHVRESNLVTQKTKCESQEL